MRPVALQSLDRFASPLAHRASAAPVGDQVADLRQHIDRLLDGEEAGVYGVDREGRATLVTPSVAAMTGHTLDDLVGRTMHEMLHHSHADGADYPHEDCPIYAAFRDGKVHRAQEVFWRKDGTSFPIEYISTPLVQGGQVVGAVVVFRDLGERRQLRERIRFMLDELDRTVAGAEAGKGHCGGHRHPGPAAAAAAGGRPVGTSAAWQATMDLVRRVAPVDTTVMLCGESGTGKEQVARAIHQGSPRRARPLVTLNCAAIPAALVESELFGHERGAFTGASGQRIGRFEQAEDGTLFLDEVGELALEAQAKLLRVLQEREFERVGGTRSIPCRARVIAATNRDLAALVAAGRFRADLLYRLRVFPVELPPLRDRREDIPLLVQHFLARLAARLGRPMRGFSAEGMARLQAHHWPGNVRELENLVERAALLADGPLLEVPPLESGLSRAAPAPGPQRGVDVGDAAGMMAALQTCGWKVTGPRGAAAMLGVHPNTLRYRMRRLGLLGLGRGATRALPSP
jgi:PAS domain S-box-containing protein